jgi:hypothetical protein
MFFSVSLIKLKGGAKPFKRRKIRPKKMNGLAEKQI